MSASATAVVCLCISRHPCDARTARRSMRARELRPDERPGIFEFEFKDSHVVLPRPGCGFAARLLRCFGPSRVRTWKHPASRYPMSAMRVDVLPSPVHYRCFPHPPFIPGIGTRIRTTGTRGHTQPLIRARHGHGTPHASRPSLSTGRGRRPRYRRYPRARTRPRRRADPDHRDQRQPRRRQDAGGGHRCRNAAAADDARPGSGWRRGRRNTRRAPFGPRGDGRSRRSESASFTGRGGLPPAQESVPASVAVHPARGPMPGLWRPLSPAVWPGVRTPWLVWRSAGTAAAA